MARRRANGEGTICRRKDGRYEGAAYFLTTSGKRKRIRVYAKTREEVHAKLTEVKARAQQGVPVPDRGWKLGDYLDYWLENVVQHNRRPKTYELYELTARHYLKPGLGKQPLNRLSVPMVQAFLNQKLTEGSSIRKVQVMRTVLSAALTRAMREELLVRNVARLVELPAWERGEIHPWTADEARQFLAAIHDTPGYPAFLLLLLYGLRRGEVLGLRWRDIDLPNGVVHIRQQLQRLTSGLQVGPVKTKAGQRDLPLLSLVRDALVAQRAHQDAARAVAGPAWLGGSADEHLVFTSASGHALEPQNFLRLFRLICKRLGLRRITLHHLRHTQATLLETLGVSAREAQLILGHSHISTTQQIYQHPNMDTRRVALERVESLFLRTVNGGRSRQLLPSTPGIVVGFTSFQFGGPGGTRTLDILLKRSRQASVTVQAQSVKAVMEVRARQWIVGAVAVKLSRQVSLNLPPEEAPCSAE